MDRQSQAKYDVDRCTAYCSCWPRQQLGDGTLIWAHMHAWVTEGQKVATIPEQ
jgi:hypothetical protein